jgi:hypothetical protein
MMSAIKNGNMIQFICTMQRDGNPIDVTGATVELRLQPRFDVLANVRPDAITGIVGEPVAEEEEDGKVTATYVVNAIGNWKADFKVTLTGGEVINGEPCPPFTVEPNMGDELP